jgi:glutamine synthetase
VLTQEELESRHHVLLETYTKTLNIEALLTSNIAKQMILPVALRYQGDLATILSRTQEALRGAPVVGVEETLKEVASLASRLKEKVDLLDQARAEADAHHGDVVAHARFHREKILPAMEEVRSAADALELVVDDAVWPLPKYREMLFVY